MTTLTAILKERPRLQRWFYRALYGIMALIVLGLLLLLHLVSALQDSRDGKRRVELARKVVPFQLPDSYELTSAFYALHPHFFVLTNVTTGQKIRVMERRWWASGRTPQGFRERFWHPGQRVRAPGMGYHSIIVESTGTTDAFGLEVPYVIGPLESNDGATERGLVACLYHHASDKSLYIFGSAPAEVFSASEVLRFAASLKF